MAKFPSDAWLETLVAKLNSDERYRKIAQKWEGDMVCVIEASGDLDKNVGFYLDLWHGECRGSEILQEGQTKPAVLTLRAPYDNYKRLLMGEYEPMQALLTRKLSVQGSMAILMRNVPTVLDFVRCCREITDSYLQG